MPIVLYYRTHQRVLSVSAAAELAKTAIIDLAHVSRVCCLRMRNMEMPRRSLRWPTAAPMCDFTQRVSVLTQLVDLWCSAKVAVVVEMQCVEGKFTVTTYYSVALLRYA